MARQIKDMVISDIQNRIGDVKEFVVVDCSRVDALTANRWRLSLRKEQVTALTVKNSVAANALKRKGVSGLDSILSGPSTLIWGGEDIVALSKCVAKWAKEIKGLEIKGGTAEGESLSADAVDILSKSSGRKETIGEILGLMMAPGRQLAGCLQGPAGTLAGQFKTLSEKEGDSAE